MLTCVCRCPRVRIVGVFAQVLCADRSLNALLCCCDCAATRPHATPRMFVSPPQPLPPPQPTTNKNRSYLFSSDRILDALGSSLISHSEALIPLCTTLDEVCVSAGVGHGRLLLLQAAASLFVGLAQQPKARQQLLQSDEAQRVISSCLKVGGWK